MEGTTIIAFASLAILVIFNVIVVAFGYGKTTGNIEALSHRVDTLSHKIDDGFTCKFHTQVEKEIGSIQGELRAEREG